jgi:hypothetical protein
MPKAKRLPPSVLKAMEGAGVSVPQIAELVGHFMQLAGGAQKFAVMLMEEFRFAPAGSLIRQRILESVLRMMSLAGQQMGTSEETDLVSTADLERELAQIMGGLPDGQTAQEAAQG